MVSEWILLENAHDYVQDTSVNPRPLVGQISEVKWTMSLYNCDPDRRHCSWVILPPQPCFRTRHPWNLKGVCLLAHWHLHYQIIHFSDECIDFGHSHLTSSSSSMTVDPSCGGSWNWLAPENVKSDHRSSGGCLGIWDDSGMHSIFCKCRVQQ
ncbi:hypothetical protein V8B97DRAFT_1926520 [Scleroderma yunnanense]